MKKRLIMRTLKQHENIKTEKYVLRMFWENKTADRRINTFLLSTSQPDVT